MKVEEEYARIRGLFADCEETQLALLDGAFWECARLRSELDRLHGIADESGLVKVSEKNPKLQKELPVARTLTRMQASYINYLAKLNSVLGKAVTEEDDGLDEFL